MSSISSTFDSSARWCIIIPWERCVRHEQTMEKQRSICHAEGLGYLVDRTELAMGLHMVSFRLVG